MENQDKRSDLGALIEQEFYQQYYAFLEVMPLLRNDYLLLSPSWSEIEEDVVALLQPMSEAVQMASDWMSGYAQVEVIDPFSDQIPADTVETSASADRFSPVYPDSTEQRLRTIIRNLNIGEQDAKPGLQLAPPQNQDQIMVPHPPLAEKSVFASAMFPPLSEPSASETENNDRGASEGEELRHYRPPVDGPTPAANLRLGSLADFLRRIENHTPRETLPKEDADERGPAGKNGSADDQRETGRGRKTPIPPPAFTFPTEEADPTRTDRRESTAELPSPDATERPDLPPDHANGAKTTSPFQDNLRTVARLNGLNDLSQALRKTPPADRTTEPNLPGGNPPVIAHEEEAEGDLPPEWQNTAAPGWDIDELYDELTERIQREFKRFYGK